MSAYEEWTDGKKHLFLMLIRDQSRLSRNARLATDNCERDESADERKECRAKKSRLETSCQSG